METGRPVRRIVKLSRKKMVHLEVPAEIENKR